MRNGLRQRSRTIKPVQPTLCSVTFTTKAVSQRLQQLTLCYLLMS